jgi:hypothetical protein
MKKFFTEPVFLTLSFLIPFLIYWLTLAPHLTFTDAGELASVAVTLGVAHPTGYPLFTLLAHLWTKLPFPVTPIYALNLFAAFCTALSAVLFFKVALLLMEHLAALPLHKPPTSKGKKDTAGKNPKEKNSRAAAPAELVPRESLLLIAFCGTLTYAFARTIWAQATSIEVYSLHLVMLSLSIFFFLNVFLTEEKNTGDFHFTREAILPLALWAFILGIGFTNHLTMVLQAPAMLFLFFKRFGFKQGAWKRVAVMAVPFLVGLSVYLYLPLRSSMLPEFNWGEVHRGVDKFLYHTGGKQYQINMFNGSWLPQFVTFFKLYGFQLGFIGFLPMLIGLVELWKIARDIFWFLVLLILGCVFYSVNYNIHDIESYFALAFLASLLVMTLGLYFFLSRKPNLIYASLLIPITTLGINYQASDHTKEHFVEDYSRMMLNSLEPNAIILSSQWDYFCSGFWYLQHVEGLRPDVILVEKELLRRTWYLNAIQRQSSEAIKKSAPEFLAFGEDLELFESGKPYNQVRIQARFTALLNSFVDKNISERPVYATIDVIQSESDFAKAYQKIPQGLALKLLPQGAPLPELKTPFDFSRFFDIKTDALTGQQMFKVAAAEVMMNARYAQERGNPTRAAELTALANQLSAAY